MGGDWGVGGVGVCLECVCVCVCVYVFVLWLCRSSGRRPHLGAAARVAPRPRATVGVEPWLFQAAECRKQSMKARCKWR